MPSRTVSTSHAPRFTRRSVLRIGIGTVGCASMLSMAASVSGAANRRDVDDDERTIYNVVVNHEEQYSIWPADRELPLGWSPEGFQGTRHECLVHIEQVWTDMRPKSVRDRLTP